MTGKNLDDRIARLRGFLRRHLLRWAEHFAYAVAGLPMVLWWTSQLGPPSPDLPPAEYLHRYYANTYWRLPLGPLKFIAAAIAWPIALPFFVFVFIRRNGAAIRERSRVGLMQQVVSQIVMAARHSIVPMA